MEEPEPEPQPALAPELPGHISAPVVSVHSALPAPVPAPIPTPPAINTGTVLVADDFDDSDDSDDESDAESVDEASAIEDAETAAFNDAQAVTTALKDSFARCTPYTHNFHKHAEQAAMMYEIPSDEDELEDMCPNGCGYMGNDVEDHMTKCLAFKCTLCHVHAIGPIFGTTEDEQAKSAMYLKWNEHHNTVCPIAADNQVARMHGRPKRQSDRGWRKSNKKQCIDNLVRQEYPILEDCH